MLPLTAHYAALPQEFHAAVPPQTVRDPQVIRVNRAHATALGLDPDWLQTPEAAAILSANVAPPGATPVAMVYAGHQFGGWSPRLGDGRALLLGELTTPDGTLRDLHLKGSGRTPFARGGDGRAALGPVLREYIISEAMHALGVPTTRALAALTTGDMVFRETPLPGAVIARTASSHLRVGAFQYFAAQGDLGHLETLYLFARDRHDPGAATPLVFFAGVVARQAQLIARWLSLGFVHGVMNTDNMTISGETIDYGPCAFLDTYEPSKVFSSIDRHGRYAYDKQADMAVWNLAQLATALLPLMGPDQDANVTAATKVLHGFSEHFSIAWRAAFRAKLGLTTDRPEDTQLISRILQVFHTEGRDFTNGFRHLARDIDALPEDIRTDWQARLTAESRSLDDAAALIATTSPAIIPRNHQIEAAIKAATAGDFSLFHTLTEALQSPFDAPHEVTPWALPPAPGEEVTQTFCGT